MTEIDVTLIFKTPLNIGSGAQQGTLTQRGMLKDRRGWPYVPASALKGRLRHAVEQVAAALDLQPSVCRTHQDMCRERPCPVCRLFGSPWVAGAIRVQRLELTGPPALADIKEKQENPRTDRRTGVAINRRRRVAQDAFLYDTELLWPGAALEFGGTITGHFDEAQAALLLAGLRLIPAMGRGKSGGLGWTEVQATVRGDDGEEWPAERLRRALKVLGNGEGSHDE